jgi:hypothetical protein
MKLIICLMISLSLNSYALTNSKSEENEYFNSVVFIKSDAPDAKGDTTPGFCNATLLAKNMAITAAHCVHLAYVSGVKKITVEKGAYKYKQMPDGTIRKIGYVAQASREIQAEIEFSNNLKDKMHRSGFKAKIGPDEDVAIIWWQDNTDIFSQTIYPEIASINEFNLISKNISNYQLMVTSINPFSEMSLDTKRSAVLDKVKWTMTNYVESKSIARVEEGDSGSPLFVKLNNSFKIFAVVKGKASTVFDNWDAYAAVSKIACEIDKGLPSEFRIKSCNK